MPCGSTGNPISERVTLLGVAQSRIFSVEDEEKPVHLFEVLEFLHDSFHRIFVLAFRVVQARGVDQCDVMAVAQPLECFHSDLEGVGAETVAHREGAVIAMFPTQNVAERGLPGSCGTDHNQDPLPVGIDLKWGQQMNANCVRNKRINATSLAQGAIVRDAGTWCFSDVVLNSPILLPPDLVFYCVFHCLLDQHGNLLLHICHEAGEFFPKDSRLLVQPSSRGANVDFTDVELVSARTVRRVHSGVCVRTQSSIVCKCDNTFRCGTESRICSIVNMADPLNGAEK